MRCFLGIISVFMVQPCLADRKDDLKEYGLECQHQAIVELEDKNTGVKAQVQQDPKVTIGQQWISQTQTRTEAEVFSGKSKQYRYIVDKRLIKSEVNGQLKQLHYSCKGQRFDPDGTTHDFCGPMIEVYRIGPYGTEVFLGYLNQGEVEESHEIRFKTTLEGGEIIESMTNQVPRKTYEDESSIWRIYFEKRNCLLTPAKKK